MQFMSISAIYSLCNLSDTKNQELRNSKRNLTGVIAKKLLLQSCKKYLDSIIHIAMGSKELHITGMKFLIELCTVSKDLAKRVGEEPTIWSQLLIQLNERWQMSDGENIQIVDCILELILCTLTMRQELPQE